ETWSSPADEGWRAAEVANSPVSGGTTAAGLPVRVPKANLVPGTVSSAATAPPPPAPARSAAQAQERLASFQRGIRNARAATQGTNDAGGEGEPGDEDGDGVTRLADLSLLPLSCRRSRAGRGPGWTLRLPPGDHDAGESAQNADRKDHGAEDEDLRRNADPGGAVDPHRERHRAAADEVRGHEVVDGQGQRHQRAGQNARHDERQRDLPERGPGVRAQVRGGLLQRPVEAGQPGP